MSLRSISAARSNVVKAVDGSNVQIESGEFVSIVGRSGSGKTTTGPAGAAVAAFSLITAG